MQTGVIELHIRECEQLFDSLDPYPFYERDLDTDAEEYIVASVRELPERKARSILVHVDQPSVQPEQQRDVEQAIRNHFERKTRLAARELRELVRRGWISLVIGLAFLATLLIASEAVARSVQPPPLAAVLSESLVIGGWVAMWKPLEIFLYDWWPIVGRRRLYEALSQVPVRVVAHDHSSGDTKAASSGGV
jgi:hypothetical protein